jgi:hypothetical protein
MNQSCNKLGLFFILFVDAKWRADTESTHHFLFALQRSDV